jgi:hypothetical protein
MSALWSDLRELVARLSFSDWLWWEKEPYSNPTHSPLRSRWCMQSCRLPCGRENPGSVRVFISQTFKRRLDHLPFCFCSMWLGVLLLLDGMLVHCRLQVHPEILVRVRARYQKFCWRELSPNIHVISIICTNFGENLAKFFGHRIETL